MAAVFLKWYLPNCLEYTVIGAANNTCQNILSSVTQDSILGMLVFLLWFNDLSNTSEVIQYILCADDIAP